MIINISDKHIKNITHENVGKSCLALTYIKNNFGITYDFLLPSINK